MPWFSAITTDAVAAVPAATSVGGVTFAYEINLTTVLIVVAGVVSWYLTLQRQGDKVRAQTAINDEVSRKIEALELKMVGCDAENRTLRDELYRDYLSTATWREIKNELRADAQSDKTELSNQIRDLSQRVDSFADAARLREVKL